MLTEYEAAIRLRKEDGPNLAVLDRNHKTYPTASPEMLIFNKLGTAYLEMYIHMVHPQVACHGSLLNVFPVLK